MIPLALALLLAAPPIRELVQARNAYPVQIQTDVFDVLDVSFEKKLVAFRHIYRLPPPDAPVDDQGSDDLLPAQTPGGTELTRCLYPGLRDYPQSGMIVGIYDLAADRLKGAFLIYESTMGACTTPEKYEAARARAEKRFKAEGLASQRSVSALALAEPKDGVQNFVLSNGKKRYEFRATNVHHSEGEPANACGDAFMVTGGVITLAGKTVWVRCQRDNFRNISGGAFVYPQAIIKGKQAVFVERFRHSSFEEGSPSRELWSFTKIFTLK